jgi:hypothetical protein
MTRPTSTGGNQFSAPSVSCAGTDENDRLALLLDAIRTPGSIGASSAGSKAESDFSRFGNPQRFYRLENRSSHFMKSYFRLKN